MRSILFGVLVFGASAWGLGYWMNSAPGTASKGQSAAASEEEQLLADRLESLCSELSGNSSASALGDLESHLRRLRLDAAVMELGPTRALECSIAGFSRNRENVVVVAGLTKLGANQNASGASVLAELTRELSASRSDYTLRMVWIENDLRAGAKAYEAALTARGEKVRGCIVLDRVGIYSTNGSQQRWPWFARAYQEARADTITFQSNIASRAWMEQNTREFRQRAKLPTAALSAPASWLSCAELGWLETDWDVVVVTDTGAWRDTRGGGALDTPERLNYTAMARLTQGLAASVSAVAKRDRPKL